MWRKANREKCSRDGLRYPSNLTEVGWALVEPLIPPAKREARPTAAIIDRQSVKRAEKGEVTSTRAGMMQ